MDIAHKVSRRQFLQFTAAAALSPLYLRWPTNVQAGTSINGMGAALFPAIELPVSFGKDAKRNGLMKLDFETRRRSCVFLPTRFAHTAMPIGESRTVFVTESSGNLGCLVDIDAMKVIKSVPAMKGYVYGGHCLFDPKRNVVYSAEYDFPKPGRIVVRNSETLKVLAHYDIAGIRPTHMVWVDGQDRFALANYGHIPDKEFREDSSGSIQIINANSFQVEKVIRLPDTSPPVAHIMSGPGEKLVVTTLGAKLRKQFEYSSACDEITKPKYAEKRKSFYAYFEPFTSPIYEFTTAGTVELLDPKKHSPLMKWTLDHTYHSSNQIYAMTHVASGHMTFWDAQTGLIKKTLHFKEGPYSVVISGDGKYFMVLKRDGSLAMINASSLAVEEENFVPPGTLGKCAHMSIA